MTTVKLTAKKIQSLRKANPDHPLLTEGVGTVIESVPSGMLRVQFASGTYLLRPSHIKVA